MTEAQQREELIRHATASLLRRSSDRMWAAVAIALTNASNGALDDEAGRAVVAHVVPRLPAAVALARQRDELVPLADAAVALRCTPRGLTKAVQTGRLALTIERRRRCAYVKRRDLERIVRPPPPEPTDPLTGLLAAALGPALAATQAEPPLLVTTSEAAARLGMTLAQLYRRLAAGSIDLRPVRVGGRLRLSAADVERVAGHK